MTDNLLEIKNLTVEYTTEGDVVHAVNIPVVGLGGISSAKDAIEFLMCGATAIEIGTANFIDPAVTKKVKDGINEWLDAHGCKSVTEIIGAIK